MDAPEFCMCCGQSLPRFDKADPDSLLRLLKAPAESMRGMQARDVYKSTNGHWYVTYGGGEWPERTVLELMARGALRPAFDDPILGVFTVAQSLRGSPGPSVSSSAHSAA